MRPATALIVALAGILVGVGPGIAHAGATGPQQKAGAGAKVEAWLSRMVRKARRQNYEGTFVYMEGHRLETFRIIHRVSGKTEEARMYSLNGQRREFRRVNGKVNCLWPDAGKMLVRSTRSANPFPSPFPSDPKALSGYYRLRMLGDGRVARHQCRRVGLIPRDPYRYGYRMCLDPQTGVLLESRLLGGHGQVLQQVLYTRMSFPRHIPAAQLKTSIDTSALQRVTVPPPQPELDAAGGGWKATRLPPGFHMVSRHYQYPTGQNVPVQHVVYTDGLATVSLFVGPVPPSGAVFNGVSRQGSLNAFGTVQQGFQVTVVGSVPMRTLRMIGTSVEYAPAKQHK